MVKLTLVGRLSDGLPLAQSFMHPNEENDASSYYRQQGELVIKEISRGAVPNPKMSILLDHHCFHCLIGNGICYVTLCESWYPRKLAFCYLQDLLYELENVDITLLESFSKPYTFKRFDYVIENIRKKYLDTRTQSNLAKVNSSRKQDLDIVTKKFSEFVCHGRPSGPSKEHERLTLWNSKLLEVIALKWTPAMIFLLSIALLLWTAILLSE